MCELWQSQIHDSPYDGVTTDVLAAMNRVTLDIVGLAGETDVNLSLFPPTVITRPSDRDPDSDAVLFFSRVWVQL